MRLRIAFASSCLALSMLLMITPGAHAQGFHSVFSRDGIDVWAVGDGGEIYRSLNGGSSWTHSTLGNRTLRDVQATGLNVVIVGDSGKIWRSQDSGGSWALTVLPGAPDLRAVVTVSALEWYAFGAGGTIVKSGDAATTWNPEVSGTAAMLRAARFTDPQHGWAVGDAGTVLGTVDGVSWAQVAVSSSASLFDVDANGPVVWAVGADGTARRSLDYGSNWEAVDLKMDTRADVRSVWLKTPNTVYLAGGGGFIRRSLDGGHSWLFPHHPLQAPISSLYFAGARAWAANERNPIVMTSSDQDVAWALPSGTTVSRSWVQKLPFGNNVRGSTMSINPIDKNVFYTALGDSIYRSPDEGEHWYRMAYVPNAGIFNAFVVSRKDSNSMVAAIGFTPKHLARSTNGGQTWTTTLTHDFGNFGIPVEADPDHPDTLYFGGDMDNLFRSTDGGTVWTSYSGASLRSPCDIVVVPDSTNIILIGDGVTNSGRGKYYKSSDGGLTFTLIATQPQGCSEIPGLACSRMRNTATYGTNWGSGGVQRSPDYGSSWPNITNTDSAWGIDIAHDDPDCVVFGIYGGGASYLSLDGGSSFTNIPMVDVNYGMCARDRATILAEQGTGIWKLQVGYAYTPDNTQSLTVTSPNGGEVWAAASTQTIGWSASNVALARIEYRKTPSDAWELVAQVPGYQGGYAWSVPKDATSSARIRVRDAWDSAPDDSSDAAFTITVSPQLTIDPNPLAIETTPVGYSSAGALSLANPGTGPVSITSVTSDNPSFYAGRSSFAIPAHSSDTLGIGFAPVADGDDSAHVTIVSDDAGSPRVVLVTGSGSSSVAVGDRGASAFALRQNRPNPFDGSTRIEYSLPFAAAVRLDVFNLAGERVAALVRETQAPGTHGVSFGVGARTASGERIASVPPGVYFYRLRAGALAATRKMLVMR
jgi:photosystem II stability/assembly factor-like uncharacterized protein